MAGESEACCCLGNSTVAIVTVLFWEAGLAGLPRAKVLGGVAALDDLSALDDPRVAPDDPDPAGSL